MTSKDDLKTYVYHRASEDMERYVAGGRRFKHIEDAELAAECIDAFSRLVVDPSDIHLWAAVTDFIQEFELRGTQPPKEAIEAAFSRIGEGMNEALQRRKNADPAGYEKDGEQLLADVEATMKKISNAPKH